MNLINKLLIFYDFFTPAFKGGGPIRSLHNLTEGLQEIYQIFIITTNGDLGAPDSLSVKADAWVQHTPQVKIWYSSHTKLTLSCIGKLIGEIQPDIVYINGFFTPKFVLFPLLMRKKTMSSNFWVIAPRGMLRKGALSIKPMKKRIYIYFFRLFNLHKNIQWHATDSQEIQDIKRVFGQSTSVKLASNVPKLTTEPYSFIEKNVGAVKLVFLSRISPEKNLLSLFLELCNISKSINVTFDVYGIIENLPYWNKCLSEANKFQSNINFSYKGEVRPIDVRFILQRYHFFVLPTLGENFGHAIYESFHAGRPVIISDKTMWRHLQQYPAGWDYCLEQSEMLSKLIEEAAQMDQDTFNIYCRGAQQIAKEYVERNNFVDQYKKLFER